MTDSKTVEYLKCIREQASNGETIFKEMACRTNGNTSVHGAFLLGAQLAYREMLTKCDFMLSNAIREDSGKGEN